MVFQLPASGIESVPQGHVNILVLIAVHDQLPAWHVQRDTHIEKLSLMLVTMRLLHTDVTTHQFRVKRLQLCGLLPDVALQRLRMIGFVKYDLQRRD